MDLEVFTAELLTAVKANLIIDYDNDDDMLMRLIRSAVEYAERYQNKKYRKCYKKTADIPQSTQQAIIMLTSHWYESRDGGTGGLFSNYVGSSGNIQTAVDRLLSANKEWVF